jgi:hypothetical protein
VKDVQVVVNDVLTKSTTKAGQPIEFFESYMKVTFLLDAPVDGTSETYENYSFRVFPTKTGGKTASIGNASKLGELKARVCESFGLDAEKTGVYDLKACLLGKKAMLLTEVTSFSGKNYNKTVIRQFRL